MKKFLKLLVCLFTICFLTFPNLILADDSQYSSAQEISLNTKVRGNLPTSDSVQLYKFTLTSCGNVIINFDHDLVANDSTSLWKIDVMTKEKIYTTFTSNDNSSSVHSVKLRLAPGEYYVKVRPDYPGYRYSNEDYNLTVNFEDAADKYEREYNDDMQNAMNIKLNSTYEGNIQTKDDIDYYKLNLTECGNVLVNFKHNQISDDSTNYWNIAITNDKKTFTTFVVSGNATNVNSVKLRLNPGNYYVKITPDNPDYRYNNEDYNISVSFESAGTKFEREENDTMDKAMNISLNKSYQGNLQASDDIDYYKFSIKKPGDVIVNFKHIQLPENNGTTYWNIKILNSEKAYTTFYSTDKSINDNSVKLRLKAGNYYIKVCPDNSDYRYSNFDYNITVKYTQAASNVEKEENNDKGSAMLIVPNITYTGNLQTSDDVDYYKFTMNKSGTAEIDFNHNQVYDTKSDLWDIMLRSGSKQYLNFTSSSELVRLKSNKVHLQKGQYYIYICPDNANYRYSTEDYKFKLNINYDSTAKPKTKPNSKSKKK